ncbi:hypothetical protein [Saccharopolyspora sp. ASAGF58]|uniref:hypothetical protein n=1 Tax=Saccharopolyspora sp. ASAGF58 TaxID=2719023 RepID=UPI0014466D18|nr:hypothetical protein [Saccharopolyspora sp. ASAGF58]
MFKNGPIIKKNKKKGRAADFVAITTNGGSRVRVNFLYSPDAKSARPISAWEL